MILEGIPVAYMGCKGVQKGDKEIRSITESVRIRIRLRVSVV